MEGNECNTQKAISNLKLFKEKLFTTVNVWDFQITLKISGQSSMFVGTQGGCILVN